MLPKLMSGVCATHIYILNRAVPQAYVNGSVSTENEMRRLANT